jgi:tetratricopeptide (TPR) repeat protein
MAHYRRALELGDYQPQAVRRVATLLVAAGRAADADRILEQAEKRGVLERDLWRPAAEIALRAGNKERACRLALLAAGGSRSPHDLIWLGRTLDAGGRPTDAGNAFEEAVRLAPEVADTWLALLAHQVRRGQRDATETCLAGLRRNLDASRLPLAEAQAREVLGQDDEAERIYRRILEREPHDARTLYRLASLYLRTDRPDRAEPVLLALFDPRVLLSEEEFPELRRQLALVMSRPGQKQDRVHQALAVLAVNRRQEGDTEADRRVAALVRGTRPTERAQALRTLEELPGGPAVLAPERLRLARLYEAAKNWPGARAQYAALIAGDPDNTTWLALFVEALLRAGKKADAARWLAELEKREPGAARTSRLREQVRSPKRQQGKGRR